MRGDVVGTMAASTAQVLTQETGGKGTGADLRDDVVGIIDGHEDEQNEDHTLFTVIGASTVLLRYC